MKAVWSTASSIATLMGILSVLLLLDRAENVGWVPVIEDILVFYQSLKNLVLSPLLPFAENLAQAFAHLFSIDLDLQQQWSDVFLLLTLYLGSRAQSYWGAGMKRRAAFRFVWGAIVGIVTGVLAGLCDPTTQFGNLLILGVIVLGLAVFDLVDAAWSATFHRKSGLTWLQDCLRYLAFSMPTIAIGIVALLIFLIFFIGISSPARTGSGILASLGYAIVLAFYWLFRGFKSSQSWEKPGTGYEKFLASSNSQIGLLMLRSLGGALIVVSFNAGYNSLIQ